MLVLSISELNEKVNLSSILSSPILWGRDLHNCHLPIVQPNFILLPCLALWPWRSALLCLNPLSFTLGLCLYAALLIFLHRAGILTPFNILWWQGHTIEQRKGKVDGDPRAGLPSPPGSLARQRLPREKQCADAWQPTWTIYSWHWWIFFLVSTVMSRLRALKIKVPEKEHPEDCLPYITEIHLNG